MNITETFIELAAYIQHNLFRILGSNHQEEQKTVLPDMRKSSGMQPNMHLVSFQHCL